MGGGIDSSLKFAKNSFIKLEWMYTAYRQQPLVNLLMPRRDSGMDGAAKIEVCSLRCL